MTMLLLLCDQPQCYVRLSRTRYNGDCYNCILIMNFKSQLHRESSSDELISYIMLLCYLFCESTRTITYD